MTKTLSIKASVFSFNNLVVQSTSIVILVNLVLSVKDKVILQIQQNNRTDLAQLMIAR